MLSAERTSSGMESLMLPSTARTNGTSCARGRTRYGRSAFFFSSTRRHTSSVSAFVLNRSSDLNGRLHFHAVHFMRTLPTGSVDPNFGRRVRNRRQLNSLQNTWPYGYSMPIAVRYTQDAFSRSGWLWPVDAKGEP